MYRFIAQFLEFLNQNINLFNYLFFSSSCTIGILWWSICYYRRHWGRWSCLWKWW